jgi:hypothetical protein
LPSLRTLENLLRNLDGHFNGRTANRAHGQRTFCLPEELFLSKRSASSRSKRRIIRQPQYPAHHLLAEHQTDTGSLQTRLRPRRGNRRSGVNIDGLALR